SVARAEGEEDTTFRRRVGVAVTAALCVQLLMPLALTRPAWANTPVAIRCAASPVPTIADNGSTLFTITGALLDASGNVVSDDNATQVTFTNETPTLISERNAVQPNPRLAQSGVA